MAYRFDDRGWYDGEVPDGSPRSTDVAPPITSTTTTPGEDRANWSGLAWVVVPYSAPPAPEYPVPQAVTMRQARLALLGAGLLSSVDAAIENMAEPTRSAARIEWEYSNELQRSNHLLLALGPALGLSPQQIDDLFVAASAL